jgi:NAD(P)-dependent dehydrogenase (short-subunit alcohol dehydrogenase family)
MAGVLITGCSAGIGRATAVRLARAGHRVFATMRDTAKGASLADLASQEKLSLSLHQLDVTSDASVTGAVASIEAPIDVLVNNAGVATAGSVEDLPLDVFRTAMETNYFGALRCIRAVLPRMRQAGAGCIVNVSSIAGQVWNSPFGAYSASKAALEAMSEVLAGEVRPFGIRVAIVQPGITDTAMAQEVVHAASSDYPQPARIGRLFKAVLSTPVPPDVVADTIQQIVETGTTQLRHPSGPTAGGFLAWRASMDDEAWVATNALPDAEWYARVARDFGITLA